ncbi:MAG TPA: hypothetical protein DCR97_11575 [Deltaproteobacteria bacterium]|nr:hypothetical protein [Deltaproteobacteria bacterium]
MKNEMLARNRNETLAEEEKKRPLPEDHKYYRRPAIAGGRGLGRELPQDRFSWGRVIDGQA